MHEQNDCRLLGYNFSLSLLTSCWPSMVNMKNDGKHSSPNWKDDLKDSYLRPNTCRDTQLTPREPHLGFGSTNNNTTSAFGANKPAFGATGAATGGGLFGSTTATAGGTGFGGFGANTANTSTTFGGGNTTTGGGLFGQAKPTFGAAAPATGSGLFGNNAGNTGFGAGNTTAPTLFGAAQGTALGGNIAECQGTGSTPFNAVIEKEPNNNTGSNVNNHFQSISFMQPYQKYSFEVSYLLGNASLPYTYRNLL